MKEKNRYVVAHFVLNPKAHVKGIKDIAQIVLKKLENCEQNEPVIHLPCPEMIYFDIKTVQKGEK